MLVKEDLEVLEDQQVHKDLLENQDLQEGEECLALMDPLDPKVKMVIEVKLDQQVQRVNLEILEDLVHLDFKV